MKRRFKKSHLPPSITFQLAQKKLRERTRPFGFLFYERRSSQRSIDWKILMIYYANEKISPELLS